MGPRFLPAVPLALIALAVPGWPEGPRDQAPVYGTEVSLVLVPVFAVDREGRAVRDLRPEDFEVTDDGRRAEIVSFRRVDTTSDEDQEELRQATAARRRFLLLFDKSFTDVAGLARARRAAGRFVRTRLAESDLVAVATFDTNNGMRLVANFTEDRALLAHAVDTLGVPALSKISDPLGLAADLQSTDVATAGGAGELEVPQVLVDSITSVLVRQMRTAEREQYRVHIQALVSGLEDLAAGLRRVEGRKQVVYFSAGFDSRLFVGEEGSDRRATSLSIVEGRLWEVDGQSRYGDSRLREAFADATRSLARADAVVHSVDVTGLGSDTSLARATPVTDPGRAAGVSGREALNYLSGETGGRFFKDANDLGPVLAEMLEMTSRYYVLGFQPGREKGPGAHHRIRVKVARRAVKLSHRPGYFEREGGPGRALLQRQFEAAQLVMTGSGPNDLDFTSLCLPFPRAGERQTLGLVLQLPRGSLRWRPGRTTAVEVYAYAVAEDGSVRDHLAQLARFDPARADPEDRARGMSFYGTLSVPPGRYTIRLMVREGDTAGVRFLEVTVPPHDPRAAFLLPPVVLDEPERWLRLDMGPGRAGPADFPFQIAGEPFLPRASFEVRPGQAEKLVLIAYEPEAPGDPAADLEIRSSLRTRDGRAVPSGRLKVDRVLREAEGRRTYVFDYVPGEVEAGDYTLRIGIGEAGTLVESYALLRVRRGS